MTYVDNLIAQSAESGEIVHGTYTERAHDEMLGRLVSDDADHVVSRDGGEYWGTDDDGREWRVHLDCEVAP
jgi:hypothetical protein